MKRRLAWLALLWRRLRRLACAGLRRRHHWRQWKATSDLRHRREVDKPCLSGGSNRAGAAAIALFRVWRATVAAALVLPLSRGRGRGDAVSAVSGSGVRARRRAHRGVVSRASGARGACPTRRFAMADQRASCPRYTRLRITSVASAARGVLSRARMSRYRLPLQPERPCDPR